MLRGSREYFSLVIGSTMSAITLTVGLAKNGSITADFGSGTASMSDALIACQPRIEEPSNPRPSSKIPSSSVSIGYVQCCQVPSMSQNLRSICSESLFFMNSKNSLGVIVGPFVSLVRGSARNYIRHGCTESVHP